MDTTAIAPGGMACPVCGTANPPEAVFCTNAGCRKALGEFPYLIEELRASTKWYESLVNRLARFVGQPWFIALHLIWFSAWVLFNAVWTSFDEYPFNLLGIILAIEAVFVTGLLLIDDSFEDERSNKQAELDYELAIQTYRRLRAIDEKLEALSRRVG